MAEASRDAVEWFLKMEAAVKYFISQKSVSNSNDLYTNWRRVRTESQKLLYLCDDHFSITKQLKKAQNKADYYHNKTDNLNMTIAFLTEALNLAKKGKARSARTFEIKLRKKEIEIQSIQHEIELRTGTCLGDSIASSSLVEKKASLEEKIRCCRERKASELASFDSKIKESEEELEKKTSKLKRKAAKVVAVEATLKLMKGASCHCEEAIAMFELAFIDRLAKLKADFVMVDESADVGIIKRVYVMRDRLRGFQLNFTVSTVDFGEEIRNICRGIDQLKLGRLYKLWIDEGGVFHIRQAKGLGLSLASNFK